MGAHGVCWRLVALKDAQALSRANLQFLAAFSINEEFILPKRLRPFESMAPWLWLRTTQVWNGI